MEGGVSGMRLSIRIGSERDVKGRAQVWVTRQAVEAYATLCDTGRYESIVPVAAGSRSIQRLRPKGAYNLPGRIIVVALKRYLAVEARVKVFNQVEHDISVSDNENTLVSVDLVGLSEEIDRSVTGVGHALSVWIGHPLTMFL